MLLIFVSLFCYVLSQSCSSSNAICVGVGEAYTTLTAGINAVTPESGIQYILLTDTAYSVLDEPGDEILINETHAAGTPGNYITIMPVPTQSEVVTITYDASQDDPYHWFLIGQPYWKLSGGESKKLRFLTSGDDQDYWLGYFTVVTESTGKFMFENVIFETDSGDSYGPNFIGIWCDDPDTEGLCDDENFDGIIIDNCEFKSPAKDPYGCAVKGNIKASSWNTLKIEIKNCEFFTNGDGYLWNYIRVPHYGPDLGGNTDYRSGGWQNVAIHDNNFGETGQGFHIDIGHDIRIYDNTFTLYKEETFQSRSLLFLGPTDQQIQPENRLSGLHFYDNTITFPDDVYTMKTIVHLYDQSTTGSEDWIEDLVIRNNVINNLRDAILFAETSRGYNITIESNVVDAIASYRVVHGGKPLGNCMVRLECEDDDSSQGDHSISFVNNRIEWDMKNLTGRNDSWFCSSRVNVNLDVAYNYFSLSETTDELVHMFEGGTGPNDVGYLSINMYGNVVYQENGGDLFTDNHEDFMKSCGELYVTNNLFSTEFVFPAPGENVTVENNGVSEDESAYDETDPCETDYVVPYDASFTPETDMNGYYRATEGDTWIGPVSCFVPVCEAPLIPENGRCVTPPPEPPLFESSEKVVTPLGWIVEFVFFLLF